MLKKIFAFVAILLLLLIIIILFNTFTFKSKQPYVTTIQAIKTDDSAVAHLQQAIRHKTISLSDSLPSDTASFKAFHQFLSQSYPLVFQSLQLERVNDLSLLFTWEGKDATLSPVVLMAHQDIVPVEDAVADQWILPPFDGAIKDGLIYGRGTCDDKGCMIAILEATEMLLQKGIQPKRTIHLVFGHDEEIGGANGSKAVASLLAKKGKKLHMVLDEGGMITNKKVPGMEGKPVAVVGTAEKGNISLQLSVNIVGGHSSMPEKETAIDVLAAAITRLHQKQFDRSLSQASKDFFNHVGPEMPFTNKLAVANLWLFNSVLLNQLGKSNSGNAMIRTTISPTIFNSGVKDNVIPTNASAIVNFRILPGMTAKDVIAHVTKAVNEKRVTIKVTGTPFEPTPVTPAQSAAFKTVMTTIREAFPGTTAAPYLCMAATDARYFCSIFEATLRFAPFTDMEGYHGINEHIKVSDFHKAINFYYQLMLKL